MKWFLMFDLVCPEAVHHEEGGDGEEVEPVGDAGREPGQARRKCSQLSSETNQTLRSQLHYEGKVIRTTCHKGIEAI